MSSESVSERPEVAAFRDLAQLVRHLEDELASFRRRALSAEARVKELEAATGSGGGDSVDAIALKRENGELAQRIEVATARTKELVERVRFVRQQAAKAGGDK